MALFRSLSLIVNESKKIAEECEQLSAFAMTCTKEDGDAKTADLAERKDQLKEKINQFSPKWLLNLFDIQHYIDECEMHIDSARHNLSQRAKMDIYRAKRTINPLEGNELSEPQINCIVESSPSSLVLAGAGTGKTTCAIGRAKYLLSQGILSDKILVVSLTNASVSDIKERIQAATGAEVQCSTFHKAALDMIKDFCESNGKTPPSVFSNLTHFVSTELKNIIERQDENPIIYNYILQKMVDSFIYLSDEEEQQLLKNNQIRAFDGTIVKNHTEELVANYLYLNQVKYQYCQPYPVSFPDENVVPTFYLTDYGICIETNSENENEKQSICKKNGFKMEVVPNGVDVNAIERLLKENKVTIRPININRLLKESTLWYCQFTDMVSYLVSVITVSKNKNKSLQSLVKEYCDENKVQKDVVFLQLATDIYDSYSKYLKDTNQIDFSDILIKAAKLLSEKQYTHEYDYVIVDEYQDITTAEYNFLAAMRDNHWFQLSGFGDDWQSIYKFNGSNIHYVKDFCEYWPKGKVNHLEHVYRNKQSLVEISSNFILLNSNQIDKKVRGENDRKEPKEVVKEFVGQSSGWVYSYAKQIIDDLPQDSSVFFLGRYQSDGKTLFHNTEFELSDGTIKYANRPDLSISFMTIHKAKGLQADYVFIINNKVSGLGIPSSAVYPSLIDNILDESKNAIVGSLYEEERRLFYVAMTRAKKKIFLLTIGDNSSSFYFDLKRDGERINKNRSENSCPLCGGSVIIKHRGEREFKACENRLKNGCIFVERGDNN